METLIVIGASLLIAAAGYFVFRKTRKPPREFTPPVRPEGTVVIDWSRPVADQFPVPAPATDSKP